MRHLNPDIALHDAFREPAAWACLGLQLRHGDRVGVPRGLLGCDGGCTNTPDSRLAPSTMLSVGLTNGFCRWRTGSPGDAVSCARCRISPVARHRSVTTTTSSASCRGDKPETVTPCSASGRAAGICLSMTAAA